MQANVFKLGMAHPGDLSELAALIEGGKIRATDIVAVIGKTEGNGGVNDFTRGYFTQSLMALLSRHIGEPPEAIATRLPCVLSGGTEGVLTPHYLVFCRQQVPGSPPSNSKALCVGTAMSAPVPVEDIGREAHAISVARTVLTAMHDAGISDPADVHFVQVKCPCVTSARATRASRPGLTTNSNHSMATARAAGAFGVALALGEIGEADVKQPAMLQDFSLFSPRASISSGVEVECNEVIVLGNSANWSGELQIAHSTMDDAVYIAGVYRALDGVGLTASPQLSAADRQRVRGVLVKCEPDRRGSIRGNRHTMLDDTDINAQRHIRGALGGLVAGVIGDGRIFVSGGAEHQGPDGGGLIAVIAERSAQTGQ